MKQDFLSPREPVLAKARRNVVFEFFRNLGPGLTTGAADDDPSGIATYSAAGALLGTGQLWTALLTWPFMASVQFMCARIGMVTGEGLSGALHKKFPKWLIAMAAIALLIANTINIGSDLSGMADAAEMLTGLNSHWYVFIFGIFIAVATIWIRYFHFAKVLKWLALVLFAYVITAFVVGPDWSKVAHDTFVPSLPKGHEAWAMLVAILGTTISPYLFYWQASMEVEEEKAIGRRMLAWRRGATKREIRTRRIDVGTGTFFSNLVMYFIILTTALTLHAHGMTHIDTTKQAAEALLPLAGKFAYLLFTIGYKRSLQKEMAQSGIHMLVSTEGCPMEAASLALHGGEIPKFLPEDRVPSISAVPGVKSVTRMLIFSVPGEGNRTDLFYGVDNEMLKLKPHWKLKGGWFNDEQSIVLGAEAAKVEKRDVGDKVFFPEIQAEFSVTGVLERTGSEDDGFFFIPLKTAQRLFHKDGKLTGVGVHVDDGDQIQNVKDGIERIPDVYVVTAQQMMEQILKLVGSSKTLMFAMLAIALAIAVLGVLNTVLMSVMEKLREFGYMRCVGASPLDVFKIVLTETVTLCFVGGLLGVTVGALGSSLADRLIRGALPYAPAGKMVVFDPQMLLLTVAVAVFIGALAGLYPSWKASHVSPMEAIRNE